MSLPISTLVSDFLAAAGLIVLLYRLKPWLLSAQPQISGHEPLVSIIVPCRNEAANLPRLLNSLEKLRYRNFEIIIVNDHSSDDTQQIAVNAKARFKNLRVIETLDRPLDWGGKNWACYSAVSHATGDYWLFTDADTTHTENSLHLAIHFIRQQNVGLISAPPFHRCIRLWEKLLGSFQVLPLIAGAYRQPPTPSRLFAIGQYLLFTRESYEALGGHSAVRGSIAEDFDLAQTWIRSKKGYAVYPWSDIYKVQMYDSFAGFLNGWTRILRLGLKRSQVLATLEIAFCLNIFGVCLFSGNLFRVAIAIISFAVLGWSQRPLGGFSIFGALLAPLGAWLFGILSFRAAVETLLGFRIKWRGRKYKL